MRMQEGATAGRKRELRGVVGTRHVIHLIKIECSSFDVQRLCHECTSGISVPADGGYRYRSWQCDIDLCGEHHERAACQSSSCRQGGHGRGQGSYGDTARVADAAGNCRFCKLSSIKLSENKLHNIMAKWTIKARDALFGQFV